MKILFLFLLLPLSAWATLGEAPVYGQARVVAQKQSLFTNHVTATNKLSLRQYTGGDGKVFAVAWKGKNHPNMRLLLGAHYALYHSTLVAAHRNHHGHGPLVVELNGLHLELGGHLNAVSGRIWLLSKLPPKVDTNDIQ